ncbi:MAG: SurA N-terminal domain-containing protein [Candidatus Levybacteria bacterium]|nr:SurA N-terminal domain-containing protein [Candidatus Levybacteria bacterium]
MPVKRSVKASKAQSTAVVTKKQDTSFAKFKNNYLTKKYLSIFFLVVIILSGLYIFRNQIIVATVNGEPINRFTLINELEKLSGKRALETIVTKTLVMQDAKKKNVSVTEDEINSEIKKIEENLKAQGQTLEDVLKLQGATLDTVREQITLNLLMKKLLGKDIAVSDSEILDYVEKNKEIKPESMPEEEYKKQVKTQLEQQKFQEKAQTYIKKLQDSAQINYYLNL